MGNDIIGILVIPLRCIQVHKRLAGAMGGNGLALFHNFAANRTDLIAGVTIFGAGGFPGVPQFGFPMAQRRSEMIVVLIAADRTDILVATGGGAGGGNDRLFVLVALGGNVLLLGLAADGTGVQHHALFGATRLHLDDALVPAVAGGGNDLSPLYNLAADGADLVAGVTIFRAGGFLGIPELGLVAQSGNNGIPVTQAAAAAVVLGVALCCASGLHNLACQIVSQRLHDFGIGVIAFCTGPNLIAVALTSSGLGICKLIVVHMGIDKCQAAVAVCIPISALLGHLANVIHHSQLAGFGVHGVHAVEIAVARKQVVDETGETVVIQIMATVIIAVGVHGSTGNDAGDGTGYRVQGIIVLLEGFIEVDDPIIAHRQSVDEIVMVKRVQRLQNTSFQIYNVNGRAVGELLHLAVAVEAIAGAQGHQAVVGLVIGQVTYHKLCHTLIRKQLDMGHNRLGIGNDCALESLGIQREEIVLLIEAINHIIDGGDGGGDGLLNPLSQVGDLGHITSADVGPPLIRHIVGQEAGIGMEDRNHAGALYGAGTIGDRSCDVGNAHRNSGDDAVLVHRGNLFVGGRPGDPICQGHGQSHSSQGLGGAFRQNDLLRTEEQVFQRIGHRLLGNMFGHGE